MRHDRDLRVRPKRTLRRQRLRPQRIERGIGQLPGIERRDQILLDDMLAAPDIDNHCALWHRREVAGAENPLGLARLRQQAHRDIGFAQKRLELIGAVEDPDLPVVAGAAHPGRHRKAERLQHQRRRRRHKPEAEKPDAPLLRPHDAGAQPFAIALRLLVFRHLAVKPQHMHDDVFGHHRVAAIRLDLAERYFREARVIDKRLDPGRAAEHRLQFREVRQRVEIGPHKGEVFDLLGVARFRPDSDFHPRQLRRERRAPRLRIPDHLVEIDDQQRHVASPIPLRAATIASLGRKCAAHSIRPVNGRYNSLQ